jgi:hypothetical protein
VDFNLRQYRPRGLAPGLESLVIWRALSNDGWKDGHKGADTGYGAKAICKTYLTDQLDRSTPVDPQT